MSRCIVCRASLTETSRRGSQLDHTCNAVVNPRRDVRQGSYEERLDQLQRPHSRLRAGRAGWGRYAFYDLAAMAREEAEPEPEPAAIIEFRRPMGARARR